VRTKIGVIFYFFYGYKNSKLRKGELENGTASVSSPATR
jgi:hypothetical protein